MDEMMSTQWMHGLRAICKCVDGVAVAQDVAVVDAQWLTAWLIAHPAEVMRLWDEMNDYYALQGGTE